MLLADAFDHVVDSKFWHFFDTGHVGFNLPFGSKFIILELLAAGLILAIFIPLARRMERGDPPTGKWDNFFESFLTFVRDRIVRPNLGEHDTERFLPFFWTIFLFILFNNLFGMLPWMGSPTASISVTAALALVAFVAIHGSAIAKQGFGQYVAHHFPHIDAHWIMAYAIGGMIFVIEIFGHFIKGTVLAVRLFANMFAGHLVLAFILSFIVMAKNLSWFGFWPISMGSSALLVIPLSMLELFVACLQAYVFSYLTALFMGTALHPAH